MEDLLREAACLGNLDAVQKLLQKGACINSQHSINGWTALHWACERGHVAIVQHLLQNGADIKLLSHNCESVADVAGDEAVRRILAQKMTQGPSLSDTQSTLASRQQPTVACIVPNYLQHPAFPYYDVETSLERLSSVQAAYSMMSAEAISHCSATQQLPAVCSSESLSREMSTLHLSKPVNIAASCSLSERGSERIPSKEFHSSSTAHSSVLVVKVRVCGSGESDFVEVEVRPVTYQALLTVCCEELEVGSRDVVKIRKLPNVLVRKDRDVQHMREGQELEVVLKTEPSSASTGTGSAASPIPASTNYPTTSMLTANTSTTTVVYGTKTGLRNTCTCTCTCDICNP